MKRIACWLSLVLVGGMPGGGVFAEFVKEPCEMQEILVDSGVNDPYACGSTSCPPNVKTEATIVRPENLRVKGTMFIPTGGIEKIDINLEEYDNDYLINKRRLIPEVGTSAPISTIQLTPNGKWIMYRGGDNGNSVYLIDTSGSGRTMVHVITKTACLWRGRGDENTIKVLIMLGSERKVFSQTYDVSTGTPIRTDGDGDGTLVLSGKPNGSSRSSTWFAAGKDYACVQERHEDDAYDRGYFYKIPNGGAATDDDRFPFSELYPAQCNFTVDMTGTMLAGNFGHGYQDCMPDNHKGPCLMPIEKFSGDPKDFITQHAISINWCPTDYEGKNLRLGKHDETTFDWWNWTNDSSYLVCSRKKDHPSIGVYGDWLVNWKTNEWTRLPTYPSITVQQFAVHISGPRNVDVDKYAPTVHRNRRGKAHELNVWRDLLGRKTNSGSSISAKGIQIDNAGTKVNNVDKTGKR